MLHAVLHRAENSGIPAVVAIVSWFSRIPLVTYISLGWLALAAVREVRMWKERRDRKAGVGKKS